MKKLDKETIITYSIVAIAFIVASMAATALYFSNLPPIESIENYQPTLVSQVVSDDDVVIKTFGAYKSTKVSIDEVPENFKNALIATEDKNFYNHSGFDITALIRSTFSNIKAGRTVQGASTITQQLSRILFLSTERTMTRKIKELIIAYRLEKSVSKDKILEMYVNNVYLGEGAYGLSAAAEIYFNKKISELTLPECALIAGLPQAPSVYSPYRNMDLAIKRRNKVLRRMLAEGYITQREFEKADKARIRLNGANRPYSLNKAPYFVDYVMNQLEDKTGITEEEFAQGGYKIYTTLNYQYQRAAEEQVQRNATGAKQAALVSMDVVTGKILAYVGGRDYVESQFDRASQAVRQPGSSFKAFVYTTAMERGYTPFSVFDDSHLKIGEWSPNNYGRKYRGKIPLYKALAFSSNVVAVRLIKEIGVWDVISTARKLGITTPIANDITIALGSSGVKLIEITNAYGAIANGGIKVEPYVIERVEAANGKIIYQSTPSYKRVLETKTAAYMVEMLKQVVLIGTGKASNIGRPSAGKTGTTDAYRDAWFIGFTPEIVTGVWVGNDNNKSLGSLTGGGLPAVIWRNYMKIAEADKPIADFVYPDIELEQSLNQNFTKPKNTEPVPETTTEETPMQPETDNYSEQPIPEEPVEQQEEPQNIGQPTNNAQKTLTPTLQNGVLLKKDPNSVEY